ncbi:galactosyltransferase domain-containing protein [Phthorimaea operculella]|nr:galactosyltransferase domain-containing protein [Phthorimaea operculella]
MDCEALKAPNSSVASFKQNRKVEYAVLILSKPSNIMERDTIRETWKRLASNIIVENGERIYRWDKAAKKMAKTPDFIKFYFAIGTQDMSTSDLKALVAENKEMGDLLLLENHTENYKTLSEKLLKSLEWFSENLKNLKYLVKVDDDSFVRIDLIIQNLEAYAPSMSDPQIAEYVSYKPSQVTNQGLYWGYFNGRARVYLTGKWKEEDWFLCDKYLPYALGGGYVISKKIVDYVGRNKDMLSPYNSEDVSMGVWTAALRGINRVHDLRFDTEWTSRGCSNDMIIRHKQTPTDMLEMYNNLFTSQGRKLCSSISEKRKSYRYKWDVLPSGCCT